MAEENGGRDNGYRHFVSFFVVLAVLGLGIGIGTLISTRVGAIGPGDSQLKIASGTANAGEWGCAGVVGGFRRDGQEGRAGGGQYQY